ALVALLSQCGGVAVLIYLLGWLLLPAEGDTATPVEAVLGRGRSRTNTVLTVVVAALVLIPLMSLAPGAPNPGLVGALILGGVLLLLLRDQRGRARTADARA